jgi:hypothetical protein
MLVFVCALICLDSFTDEGLLSALFITVDLHLLSQPANHAARPRTAHLWDFEQCFVFVNHMKIPNLRKKKEDNQYVFL